MFYGPADQQHLSVEQHLLQIDTAGSIVLSLKTYRYSFTGPAVNKLAVPA